MSKWIALQKEFQEAHNESGIKPKEWCEQQGLNYATARRHIKLTKTKAKIKTAVKEQALKENPHAGALKHGGYSKYFNKDITELIPGTNLDDELELCRARVHLVIKTIEDIQEQLKQPLKPEVAASLYDTLIKADMALDRNIARVESLTKTQSSIRIDDVQEHKIIADTEKSIEITKSTIAKNKKDIVQTRLIELQVDKAEKEAGGISKLDSYIDDLVAGNDKVVG